MNQNKQPPFFERVKISPHLNKEGPTEVYIWAIVPAAGVGKRMGQSLPKQYMNLNGMPVLQHTLSRLTETQLFENIVLGSQPNDGRAHAIASLFPDVILAAGGSERFLTVRNALSELADKASENDWVFVHDAVRPCIRPKDIIKLYQAIEHDPVGGLLALPIRDTIKQSQAGRAVKTIDRDVLWQAQTPQAFRYGLLVEAVNHAIKEHLPITDEASAVEAMGYQPLLVEGSSDNLKITYPEDLTIAEAICV